MKSLLVLAVALHSTLSFASLYNCDAVAKTAAMKAAEKKFNCKEVRCEVGDVTYTGMTQGTTIKHYKVTIHTESGSDLWIASVDANRGCTVKGVKYVGEI